MNAEQKAAFDEVRNALTSGVSTRIFLDGPGNAHDQGGRTFHSRFKAPLELTEDMMLNIKRGSNLAELIARTKVIVWDEALLEALDRTLKDIMV